jgi:hypothetical protein
MIAKSLLMAGTILVAIPAFAQEASAPSWTPEIIVTAERPANYAIGAASVTRTPVPLINTPQSIQVLTRTLLDEQQLFTLADAVRNISGVVTALPSEAVLANPIVRGFESEVFVDGLIAYGDTAVVDPSSLSGSSASKSPRGRPRCCSAAAPERRLAASSTSSPRCRPAKRIMRRSFAPAASVRSRRASMSINRSAKASASG